MFYHVTFNKVFALMLYFGVNAHIYAVRDSVMQVHEAGTAI